MDCWSWDAHFYRTYRPPSMAWLVSGGRESSLLDYADLGAGVMGFGTINPGIVGKIFHSNLGMEEGRLSE